MNLKAVKTNNKGFVFIFENENGMTTTIQTASMTKDMLDDFTKISELITELFDYNNVSFEGYTLKKKDEQKVCVYEVQLLVNNIRISGKTQDLFFGIYEKDVLQTLKGDELKKAAIFSELAKLIQNSFELKAISKISELMTDNKQQTLGFCWES